MKKSMRLIITGSVQGMFFEQFVRENAVKSGVKGFMRKLEDGKIEVFLEGDKEDVESMVSICKRGPKYSNIRNVEEKPERFQDFKEFKVLKI